MSTTSRNGTETSVTFSLAELAKIEQERVREEDVKRAQAAEKQARERHEAEQRRRAAEAAELAAETEARAKRLRAEAEEKARFEARERAAADVARIEAESKARLESENAARAHELAMLRVRTERGGKRLIVALSAVLAVGVLGGSAGVYGFSQKVSGLAAETDRLREGQHALAEEREQAKSTQLAALDKRHAVLKARAIAGAEEARATAEAARNAVDRKTLDLGRLRSFADALDALQTRLDTLEKLAQLDRRQTDLAAWAHDRKHGELLAASRAAGSRARAMANEDGIKRYETALDELRDSLARSTPTAGRATTTTTHETAGTCLAGDPSCGPDGKRIF